jgi:hypothetical protein
MSRQTARACADPDRQNFYDEITAKNHRPVRAGRIPCLGGHVRLPWKRCSFRGITFARTRAATRVIDRQFLQFLFYGVAGRVDADSTATSLPDPTPGCSAVVERRIYRRTRLGIACSRSRHA